MRGLPKEGIKVKLENGNEEIISPVYADNIAFRSQEHNFIIAKSGGPFILGQPMAAYTINMPSFYDIYPGNMSVNSRDDKYIREYHAVKDKDNKTIKTVSPFLNRDQVWDGQVELEIGIWNEVVGRVMTVQAFHDWLRYISGISITDVLEDRYM